MEKETKVVETKKKDTGEVVTEKGYYEETAAEVSPRVFTDTAPITGDRDRRPMANQDVKGEAGTGMGWFALILAIASLFMAPIILGAAALIVGFIARRKGATGLGNWAIGIGLVSLIVKLMITPFFY